MTADLFQFLLIVLVAAHAPSMPAHEAATFRHLDPIPASPAQVDPDRERRNLPKGASNTAEIVERLRGTINGKATVRTSCGLGWPPDRGHGEHRNCGECQLPCETQNPKNNRKRKSARSGIRSLSQSAGIDYSFNRSGTGLLAMQSGEWNNL